MQPMRVSGAAKTRQTARCPEINLFRPVTPVAAP
jgi:hypothetical protein